MILHVNSDYFLEQRQPVYLCNGEVSCFLCGTDWIIKYYLDELRLQTVNVYSYELFVCLDEGELTCQLVFLDEGELTCQLVFLDEGELTCQLVFLDEGELTCQLVFLE
jgi:hypothetical protein